MQALADQRAATNVRHRNEKKPAEAGYQETPYQKPWNGYLPIPAAPALPVKGVATIVMYCLGMRAVLSANGCRLQRLQPPMEGM